MWPIVGYAGDFTYIGHTRDIATRFLKRIVAAHTKMQCYKKPVYVLWQLALWILLRTNPVDMHDSVKCNILLEHKHAAIPFIVDLLEDEEKAVSKLEVCFKSYMCEYYLKYFKGQGVSYIGRT